MDSALSTPSAHQVPMESTPLSSSPLRFLSTRLVWESAKIRSYPNANKSVWEIAVWDPIPMSLQMFCLFSPGHVLVYWLFLPTAVSDPNPSHTVITTVILTLVLSVQLLFLRDSFSQQSKDAAVIHKEVMNEYDTKYVHPRTQPLMRDVGTQLSDSQISRHGLAQYENEYDSVDLYAPTYVINRGFQIRPNPNYVDHVYPQGYTDRATPLRGSLTGTLPSVQPSAHLCDVSSPIYPQNKIRQPQLKASGVGDGGNLGVLSHANSPLRKSAPSNFGGFQGLRERSSSPQKKGSPLKRSSLAPKPSGRRWDSSQGIPVRMESG